MLTLPGPEAETQFRLEKLAGEIGSAVAAVSGITVCFEHYVEFERTLSERETSVLEALLDYGQPVGAEVASQAIFVVPRLGTISPWSSKATDIARICGLPVKRIERGRVYGIEAKSALSEGDMSALLPFVHDRMTETPLTVAPSRRQRAIGAAPR